MVSPSSSERIRPRDHGRASFYTRFYTAGRDWLVRSGTDWHVECAKPHLRGTGRYGTGRERGPHNPKVAGSNPAPATNL